MRLKITNPRFLLALALTGALAAGPVAAQPQRGGTRPTPTATPIPTPTPGPGATPRPTPRPGSTARDPLARFDHGDFGALLGKYVNNLGLVNYPGLLEKKSDLKDYLDRLAAVKRTELATWPRREQMAFFINAYNAVVLYQILDHYPPEKKSLLGTTLTLKVIPGFFTTLKTTIAGEEITLNDLEDKLLRGNYHDARVTCALARGTRHSGRLGMAPFTARHLDDQLNEAARNFTRDPLKNVANAKTGVITISPLLIRHPEDFFKYASTVPRLQSDARIAREAAGVLGFLALYGEPQMREMLEDSDFRYKVGKADMRLNLQSGKLPVARRSGRSIFRRFF